MSARRTTMLRFTAAALLALGLVAVLPAQATTTVTTVTYVYTDALGSPAVKADAQGNVIARYDYRPYGTQQDGPTNAGPGFTGHVNDPDTGLVYMQARYYDPEVGRFLSPDPVGATPGGIFSTNDYMYVHGNPVGMTDPIGLNPSPEEDSLCMGNLECESNLDSGGGSEHFDIRPDDSKKPYRNVRNTDLAKKITEEATKALKNAMEKTYRTRDAAAKAWAAIIQPIANKYGVEIASKLFSTTGCSNGETKIGSPTSDGIICALSYQCGGNVINGGDVSGGLLSGEIHTHPTNETFSDNDLHNTYYMYTHPQSLIENSAYVSLPNGTIYRWSTDSINQNYQPTWHKYVENTVIKVQ